MKFTLFIIKRFFTDRFHDQSALMAYYFMLAIFPFLVFVFSIMSFFPVNPNDLLSAIKPYVPEASFNLIESNIFSIVGKKQTKIAYLSLFAAFWIMSMAVQALVRSMNDAYEVVRKESFALALGKDLLLTVGMMITLSISLLVPIGEEIARVFLASHIDFSNFIFKLWTAIKWGTGSILLFAFFLILYKVVPSKKISFRQAIPGALFATIGWQLVSIGFSYYVTFFVNYQLLYGYVTNIIILMIWFFFSAAVLLLGGIINAAWINFKNKT